MTDCNFCAGIPVTERSDVGEAECSISLFSDLIEVELKFDVLDTPVSTLWQLRGFRYCPMCGRKLAFS